VRRSWREVLLKCLSVKTGIFCARLSASLRVSGLRMSIVRDNATDIVWKNELKNLRFRV